jgi:hypothetical protein
MPDLWPDLEPVEAADAGGPTVGPLTSPMILITCAAPDSAPRASERQRQVMKVDM